MIDWFLVLAGEIVSDLFKLPNSVDIKATEMLCEIHPIRFFLRSAQRGNEYTVLLALLDVVGFDTLSNSPSKSLTILFITIVFSQGSSSFAMITWSSRIASMYPLGL